MQITVPVDDSTPTDEPPGRYVARLPDGTVVWRDADQLDCTLIAHTMWLMTGDTILVDDATHGNITRMSSAEE